MGDVMRQLMAVRALPRGARSRGLRRRLLASLGRPLPRDTPVGVLLRVDATPPVWFLVKATHYPGTRAGSLGTEEYESHMQYFYDTHTCPTNWLRDVVAVVCGDDADPHGFARFVSTFPWDERLDDCNRDDVVMELVERHGGAITS